MTYHAPLPDMSFALKYGASLLPALEEGLLGDLTMDDVEAVLGEAGRMAAEVLAPLDRTGDRVGTSIKDGVVTTAPGWKEAYDAWRKGGWNGLASPAEWGGQGLPQIVNAACTEMWNGACMAFGVGPLLTMGAIDALNAHGSDVLKRAYLEKLVTGEWMGTMHLTEPQAGSDVGALRTRAERAPTALTASPDRRFSSPTASTTSPTISSTSCWRGCRTRRPARAAFRCFSSPSFC